MKTRETLYSSPFLYQLYNCILSYNKHYKNNENKTTYDLYSYAPPSMNFMCESIMDNLQELYIFLECGFSYTVRLCETKKCYVVSITWDSQEPINNLIKYYE